MRERVCECERASERQGEGVRVRRGEGMGGYDEARRPKPDVRLAPSSKRSRPGRGVCVGGGSVQAKGC